MKILNKITNSNNDLFYNNDTIYLDDHKFLYKVNNHTINLLKVYDINDPEKYECIELERGLERNKIIELETKEIKLFTII
jgi:hypothetical protein